MARTCWRHSRKTQRTSDAIDPQLGMERQQVVRREHSRASNRKKRNKGKQQPKNQTPNKLTSKRTAATRIADRCRNAELNRRQANMVQLQTHGSGDAVTSDATAARKTQAPRHQALQKAARCVGDANLGCPPLLAFPLFADFVCVCVACVLLCSFDIGFVAQARGVIG